MRQGALPRLRIQPALVAEGASRTTFEVGYARHDAEFVDFTFVTPDSQSAT